MQAVSFVARAVYAGDLFHSLSFCPDFKPGNPGFSGVQFGVVRLYRCKLLRDGGAVGRGDLGCKEISDHEFSFVREKIAL